MQLQHLFASVNVNQPSWDLFIVLFFVVSAFVYGVSLGRDRMVIILISMYMSLGVVTYAPFLMQDHKINLGVAGAGGDQFFILKAGVFLGLFLLLFFFVSRSALSHIIGMGHHASSLFQALLFSVLQVGMLVTLVLSFLPETAVAHLAPVTRQIFTSPNARFAWIVAPIIAMLLVKKSGGNGGGEHVE